MASQRKGSWKESDKEKNRHKTYDNQYNTLSCGLSDLEFSKNVKLY